MGTEGWITIPREEIEGNSLYFLEPFTKWQAWIDLVQAARYDHKPTKFQSRGCIVSYGRGQLAHSMHTLAARWKWSVPKVSRFLQLLEKEKKIVTQKSGVTTVTTILCYEDFYRDVTQPLHSRYHNKECNKLYFNLKVCTDFSGMKNSLFLALVQAT